MSRKRRPDLTGEMKDAVVRDYLRGDKVILIQMEHKISPAVMYRILDSRQVSLRKGEMKPKTVKEGTASEQLSYGLELLKNDVITAFGQAMNKTRKRYERLKYGDSAQDVFYETLFDRSDLESTAKMLAQWIKYLNALPDCEHTRGALLTLTTLMELAIKIDKLDPSKEE
ncbi:hypothetical protein LCGC14_1072050 [marine sediment metagenome]|uniref:Uncharacterized protein n=1 Tax=marine sediment metagenome TaxID=412755 RepID=A0A0F9MHW7_9ZZZZ